MLDKIAAVELKNYIINCTYPHLPYPDMLSMQSVIGYARIYIREYCGTKDTLQSVFSPETIAYTYGLLQGLK